jgi:predicted nucleic acid-binding protein
MSVIVNTTVLSNFASIDQLVLLRQLFTTLHLSTHVYEEIQRGLDEGYQFYAGIDQHIAPFVPDGWLRLTSLTGDHELQLFGALPPRLHRGEASCLALAQHRDWTFLTDDRAARTEAARLSIPVSGSIGCLVLAVDRGIVALEQANTWLGLMMAHGYRSPVVDLTPLLTK